MMSGRLRNPGGDEAWGTKAARSALRLLVSAALMVGLAETALPFTLTVDAGNLPRGGNLVLAVFRTEADWKSNANPVATSRTPVTGGDARAVLESLPPGEYAIMAFHDVNGDGVLNTSFVGKPTERYGFSNDARGIFGPPRWKSASFHIDDDVELRIRLR